MGICMLRGKASSQRNPKCHHFQPSNQLSMKTMSRYLQQENDEFGVKLMTFALVEHIPMLLGPCRIEDELVHYIKLFSTTKTLTSSTWKWQGAAQETTYLPHCNEQ
jgi:hypothetical protein